MSSKAPLRPWRAALLAAALALAPSGAWGAVVFQGAQQGSAAATDVLDTTAFTVVNGTDQVMVIAVSASGAIPVSRASFKGVAAQRFFSQDNSQPGSMCRTELWRIIGPPAGTGFVSVTMSTATSFGVGVLLYAGVDQKNATPIGTVLEGAGSTIRITAAVPDNRPLIGVACLGGSWPMRAGPDAVAGPGDLTLWDFTEKNVVGLGGQQTASGNTTVSWTVTFSDSFPWAAVGFTITPAGLAPPTPDAGVDVAPDVRPDTGPPSDLMGPPPPDAGPDLAPPPPPPDAGVQILEEDAGEVIPEPDADVPTADADPELPWGDAALPVPVDPGVATVHDVNLQVGCACRMGGQGRPGLWPLLAFVPLLVRRRRR